MKNTCEFMGHTFIQIGATRADIIQKEGEKTRLHEKIEEEIETAKKRNDRLNILAKDFTNDNF